MKMSSAVILVLFALSLARAEDVQTGHVVEGSVACLDCPRDFYLSGIKVKLKCDKVENLGTAYTLANGAFEMKLPTNNGIVPTDPSNCVSQIMGGPQPLYVTKGDSFIPISKSNESNKYIVAKALTFYKTSPTKGNNGAKKNINEELGSSKTVDLPMPREWGLAPTSYYVPFFPIIGIP